MRSQVQILSPRPLIKRSTIPKQTTIYVVRHGQSRSNQNILLNIFDDNSGLTRRGRQQAEQTGEKLANINFDAAYSSNLKRAIETASIIYGQQIPVSHQKEILRERTFPGLDGKSGALIRNIPAIAKGLIAGTHISLDYVPGMETDDELAARFLKGLEQIAQQEAGKTILVAAHGATIRTMLMKLGHLAPEYFPPGAFHNGGYVILSYNAKKLTIDEVEGLSKPGE